MKEKLKEPLTKLKAALGHVNKRVMTAIVILLVAAVAVVAVMTAMRSNQSYSVLFTDLTNEEVSSILSYLDENGTSDYQVQNDDTILVPQDQETKLKAQLIMQGYPTTGFAYNTYLDNVNTLSTDSDRETAYLFDLQDRLGAVVRCLDGVKNAWVTIAKGEDSTYVLDSNNAIAATASVLVEMDGANSLSSEQATAIRNLIAHAVSNLDIGSVSISDTVGNTYNSGDGTGDAGSASQLKLQLEEQVNNTVRTNVMAALTPFYGDDNVRVSVDSTVDINQTTGSSTTYTEPSWAADGSTNGEGIIGSKVYDNTITRDDTGTTGGTAGTETNSDVDTYVENQEQVDGTEKNVSVSGQVDYDVDTNVQQVVRTAGIVSDLMISVSINSTTAGTVDTNTILAHVARAAGIATDQEQNKISILNMPFYVEEAAASTSPETVAEVVTALPWWALYAAIGAGVLLLVLTLLLIIGHIRHKKQLARAAVKAREQLYEQAMAETPVVTGANIMDINSDKSVELRQDIRKFADDNPEIAAQMIRSWLKGGGAESNE